MLTCALHFDDVAFNRMVGKQVGGYVVKYESNFTFATVKGAGHLCPRYQPERSLAMLTRFLAKEPL